MYKNKWFLKALIKESDDKHVFLISDVVHVPHKNHRHYDFQIDVYPLIQHMKSYFNISRGKCPRLHPNILIIQRRWRGRIIRNLDEIITELAKRYLLEFLFKIQGLTDLIHYVARVFMPTGPSASDIYNLRENQEKKCQTP